MEKEQVELEEDIKSETYLKAEGISKSFALNSKIAFAFYGLWLLVNIVMPLIEPSTETLDLVGLLLNVSSVLVFVVFLIRSYLDQKRFYTLMGKESKTGEVVLYFLIGMPLYFFMYFFFTSRMKILMSMAE